MLSAYLSQWFSTEQQRVTKVGTRLKSKRSMKRRLGKHPYYNVCYNNIIWYWIGRNSFTSIFRGFLLQAAPLNGSMMHHLKHNDRSSDEIHPYKQIWDVKTLNRSFVFGCSHFFQNWWHLFLLTSSLMDHSLLTLHRGMKSFSLFLQAFTRFQAYFLILCFFFFHFCVQILPCIISWARSPGKNELGSNIFARIPTVLKADAIPFLKNMVRIGTLHNFALNDIFKNYDSDETSTKGKNIKDR